MAEKNGEGIVYHRSNCGPGYVKRYENGGENLDSECGTWSLKNWQIEIIHENDWNFKDEDLNNLISYRRMFEKGEMSQETWQCYINLINGKRTNRLGYLVNLDGSRVDEQDPRDYRGFYLAYDEYGNTPDDILKDCPENIDLAYSLNVETEGFKKTPYNR